jgi:hypothetical protein
MVARIAPSPIGSSVAIGDAFPHASEAILPPPAAGNQQQRGFSPGPDPRTVAQNVAPPPPTFPGEAFAAAVIAGQLPPRPITSEQLRQRLGSAWQPPASPLRLMDRSA